MTNTKTGRHAIFTGHIGKLEEKLPEQEIELCQHNFNCVTRKRLDKPYCSLSYSLTCQTNKYLKKLQSKVR